MIQMECLICGDSIKTKDVRKAVVFDREHKAEHAEAGRPHSRACGPVSHQHGSSCHSNCPSCGGLDNKRATR